MPLPTIGCIVTTPGRKSLLRTLHSIQYQGLVAGDDVLVVGDGFHKPTKELVDAFGYRYVATHPTRDFGHSQMNYGLKHIRGDYVIYQDDDDIFVPGAFDAVREGIERQPGVPLLGRIKTPGWGMLWYRPVDTLLDGHCLIVPNNKELLGYMGTDYNGDQCLIGTSIAPYDTVGWLDRMLTLTRPEWKLWIRTSGDFNQRSWWLYREIDAQTPVARIDTNARVIEPQSDRVMMTVTLFETVSYLEAREIAQIIACASQGADVWLNVPDRLALEDALKETLFEEHGDHEFIHTWPPRWWGQTPEVTKLYMRDGTPVKDWRDQWE